MKKPFKINNNCAVGGGVGKVRFFVLCVCVCVCVCGYCIGVLKPLTHRVVKPSQKFKCPVFARAGDVEVSG